MPRPDGFTRYDAGLLLVALIWGANFSAIKYALAEMPPLAFSAVRFILASVLFWVVVRLLEPRSRVPAKDLRFLIGLGVVGNTAYQAAFMIGLDRTSATNSSLIMASMPVMVALLATTTGIERLGRRLWIGMVLAVAGVVLVIATGSASRAGADRIGDLLILVACACWAVFTVGLRRVDRGVSPLRVTEITTYAGTPGLLLIGWPELRQVRWDQLGAGTWFGLLYSGILAIGVAYLLWNAAVKHIGGSRTAIYNSVIPVVALAVAWLALGEQPGPGQGVGAALVITGVLYSRFRPMTRSPMPVVPE
ncbi:MAG: DMT family transporter [Gemmatimonadales bacterium]